MKVRRSKSLARSIHRRWKFPLSWLPPSFRLIIIEKSLAAIVARELSRFQREFHHVALYLREILILAENGDEKRYGDGDSFFPSLSNRQCPASCDKNDRDIKWKDFNYDGSNPGRNISEKKKYIYIYFTRGIESSARK